MNKILPEMPILSGEVYAPAMPLWFVYGLRIIFFVFSTVLAWLSFHDWSNMPMFAKIIVCILAPTFFVASLSLNKAWKDASSPYFFADSFGMYFRHKDSFAKFLINNKQHENIKFMQYLFVPWGNVYHIRMAKVSAEEGYADGAVFDVNATAEELSAFFYSDIKDKTPIQAGMKTVSFYNNFPPAPRKVVARVKEMQNKYNPSSRNLTD